MNSPASIDKIELPPLYSETLGATGGNRQDTPTVVMLHGWGRSVDAVRPLGELLAEQCKVVMIDLPGFGRSPLPYEASNEGGGWSTEEYSERVKSFLNDAGITRYVLLGHSFGGRISLRLASKYPEATAGVILIGSHGLKRARSFKDQTRANLIKTLISTAKAIDGTIGTRVFAHYLAPKFGSRDYKAAGDLRKTLVKTVNEDLSQQAASIKAPTLLLWGANDTETPLDLAQNFNRLISDSKLFVFPNKGHEPFADVGSHLIAQYILNFISSRGLRG